MLIKFSKPAKGLIAHKNGFFHKNDELKEIELLENSIYRKQPKRIKCKNCEANLKEASFEKQGIKYTFCHRCEHLNGLHDDTDEFHQAIYGEGTSNAYDALMNDVNLEAYLQRREDIYRPKLDFLFEALEEVGEPKERLSYVDFGAGEGHFVSAMQEAGLANCCGYEVSKARVALPHRLGLNVRVNLCDFGEINELARTVNADVVSLLGVLEHVQKPRELLESFLENRRVRYLYIAIPVFSLSVFLEIAFPAVAYRQLTSGHTHLYTERSINWLCKHYNLKPIAEWWFGTDFVDFFRSISITLRQKEISDEMLSRWESIMNSSVDNLQACLDQKKMASELHMIVSTQK